MIFTPFPSDFGRQRYNFSNYKPSFLQVKKWKTGFHLIARETGARVYVGYYDWSRKEITVGQEWPLTDDAAADLRRIQEHYETLGLQGRHKENYITH